MKQTLLSLSALALLATAAQAQPFGRSQVQFWVGSGPDSTVLVIDFQDGTDDPSHAWGFLHDGTATAEDMLNAVAAADVNLTMDIPGGFVNSITYGGHAGIGGQPDYWSTWSGPSFEAMESNLGISEVLSNGSWFGCSYTDFDPALAPTAPIAALDPFAFTFADVVSWTGSGPDSTVLVVDFQDGSGSSSFAWGYLHGTGATGESMIAAIAAADPSFVPVVNAGFMSDLTYGDHAGIGGQPDWWSTWNATNMGDWAMNLGLATELGNGDFFGCSYTDFAPALRPGIPVGATLPAGMAEVAPVQVNVWPQPATDRLNVRWGGAARQDMVLYDMAGAAVLRAQANGPDASIDVRALPAGTYVLQLGNARRPVAVQ